jgi:hypothetical protein
VLLHLEHPLHKPESPRKKSKSQKLTLELHSEEGLVLRKFLLLSRRGFFFVGDGGSNRGLRRMRFVCEVCFRSRAFSNLGLEHRLLAGASLT